MRTADDLKPGERVGRYALVRELGRGAMGMVFLAEDTLLGERLAVKVLHPHLTRHPEAVARFHREIVLARRIAHKGVCRLFELHDESGLRFITMEHVEGVSLRELLGSDAPALPLTRIQTILGRVCDALAAAHDVGVIHRDLKPRNIMVRPGDEISLLDFGIATAVDGGSTLTLPGVPIGTRHFIAPEVWAGRPATPRSDQFAVGVILYAALVGRMPFSAKQDVFLLDDMRKGPPLPPSTLRGDLDAAVDKVALRALAFAPEDRFADVRALATALRALRVDASAALKRTDKVPTLAHLRTLSSSSGDHTGPSLDDVDPLVAPTLGSHPGLRTQSSDDGSDAAGFESDVTRALTNPAVTAPALLAEQPTRIRPIPVDEESAAHARFLEGPNTLEASMTAPGRPRARAPLLALALVAVVSVIAALAFRGSGDVTVVVVDAGERAPFVEPVVLAVPDAGPAVHDAGPAVELEVVEATVDAGVRDVVRPRTERVAVDPDKARWISAKSVLDATLAERGLIGGDDTELDRARARSAQLAAAKRYSDAIAQAETASARAASFVIDKAFVKKKLVRFNARFDDVKDAGTRDKLDAIAKSVLDALARNAVAEANRTLNDGFALAARAK